MSLASTATIAAVSSAVVRVSSIAAGASFTAVTEIVTVAVAHPPCPSPIVYVKLSTPLKFPAGV